MGWGRWWGLGSTKLELHTWNFLEGASLFPFTPSNGLLLILPALWHAEQSFLDTGCISPWSSWTRTMLGGGDF